MLKRICITLVLSLILLLPIGQSFALAGEYNVTNDCRVRIILDMNGNVKDEAIFVALRNVSEHYGYVVLWDKDLMQAIIKAAPGDGAKLHDCHGNEVQAIVLAPGNSAVHLITENKAVVEEIPLGYEAFIYNNQMYVHKEQLEKCIGFKIN